MFLTLARISLVCSVIISILTVFSRYVTGGIILIWRTYWEMAHFGVLVTIMLLLFHMVQMKESKSS